MSFLNRAVAPLALAAVATIGSVGCRSSEQLDTANRTVTVYVSTDRVFSEPVLREYERLSGVRVNAVYDTEETKSTGLANRLIAEKPRPLADVFWSNEPVRTLVLKSREVLALPVPKRSGHSSGARRSRIALLKCALAESF